MGVKECPGLKIQDTRGPLGDSLELSPQKGTTVEKDLKRSGLKAEGEHSMHQCPAVGRAQGQTGEAHVVSVPV